MRPVNPKHKENIIQSAVPLFAQSGYAGTSMRNIAKSAGITVAAIYHHFQDKQALYLDAMSHVFSDKIKKLTKTLKTEIPLKERFSQFIAGFAHLLHNDEYFRILLQRELLDGDESRQTLLMKQVFGDHFREIKKLVEALLPRCEPFMTTVSIFGVLIFQLQHIPLQASLPGWKPQYGDPDVIAKHIATLLLEGAKP